MAFLNEIQELEENIAFWEKSKDYWTESLASWSNHKLVNKSELSECMIQVSIEHIEFSTELVGLLNEELAKQKKEVTYA
jgi:hypothetical protein